MTSKKQTLLRLALFTAIAFSLTWIPHIICLHIFGYEDLLTSAFGVIVTLTMYAPMLGNILTRFITKEGFRDLKLCFQLKRHLRYYVIAFLTEILIVLFIAAIINCTHGNWKFEALADASFTEVITELLLMLMMPLFYIALPCFGEEFGWRGYMNQKLEQLTGTFGAVIIGGIIWGLWHAPLVAAGYNFGSGHPALNVLLMCISCVFVNVLLFWLTKKTDSIFPAVLLHSVMDMNLQAFTIKYFVSGIPDDIAKKTTDLQGGLLAMTIPYAIIGTAFFILLYRDRKKQTASADTTKSTA